jgi:hypothetical protein
MTIDINHADGFSLVLSSISPEVKRDLPSEVGVVVAIGRSAHEAFGVVPPDQLVIGIPTDAVILFPTEAVRADQLSQVGANWVFGSFFLQNL